jgi:hypothetical protein
MKKLLFITILLSIVSSGCEKEAGEGGTSSISGKVWVLNYNSDYTYINERYYGPKEDVYLIYGDDGIYSKSFETNYDGTYKFNYLRKGKYTVFCYSEDTTGTIPGGEFAVMKEIEITENNQDVLVDDLVIVK